ncbi:hypothetical protein ONZ51_g1366 [Trametes cubensis]|uniref:HD domain-containing protein n=1 Tax=Trametes cubensis TaxID=1111947 RepID=A0AAD7U1Q5_9APHY|nr:hypothetical protein ONZ51_g1366 [Trametes cubensis]
MSESATGKRVFPPLYVSSGDASADRLAFFHILERLKTQKRTGWVDHKVPGPERYRQVISGVSRLTQPSYALMKHLRPHVPHGNPCNVYLRLRSGCVQVRATVNILRKVELILHTVGDIAPREGIPKAEKRRLEAEAMHNFVHEMLHNSPSAQRIEALWKEYEEGETKEAQFVKDLDRFEMACQAAEYERNHGMRTLQPFFDSSLPHVRHPEVQDWGKALLEERRTVGSSSESDARHSE